MFRAGSARSLLWFLLQHEDPASELNGDSKVIVADNVEEAVSGVKGELAVKIFDRSSSCWSKRPTRSQT